MAVNLAYQLAHLGGRIGLLDLDVYGPSLPILVRPIDTTIRRSSLGPGMVHPIEHGGIKLLSLGFVAVNVRIHTNAFGSWNGALPNGRRRNKSDASILGDAERSSGQWTKQWSSRHERSYGWEGSHTAVRWLFFM